MASHDDLVLIINQLLKSMDKMGDSLSVVKSIGEDVKAIVEDVKLIKSRLEKIEERVSSSDQLPTKSEVLSIKQTLDSKLKPLDKVNIIDKRLCEIEECISNLGSSDQLPTKSEVLSIKQTLDRKLNPLDKVNIMDKRLCEIEECISNLSMENAYPALHFDLIVKGENVHLTNNATSAERIRAFKLTGLAGVISNVPLRKDKIHLIRILETVNNWADTGVAVGVICEKKPEIEGAQNIYRNIKGTWAINSWDTATPGKSHMWKDANIISENSYPLDTRHLPVGTTLGVKHCSNGDVHFFLNGIDKGVAFQNVPGNVYVFVDIINYVTKINIVYF